VFLSVHFSKYALCSSWSNKTPEAQRFETIRSAFTTVSAGSAFARLTRAGFSCISVDFRRGAFRLGAVREKEASATGT